MSKRSRLSSSQSFHRHVYLTALVITMECTGESPVVDIRIRLNISNFGPLSTFRTLTLKRRKMCLPGEQSRLVLSQLTHFSPHNIRAVVE